MPFFYVNGTTRLNIEDLPLSAWVEIQKATGKQWHQVLQYNRATDSLELLGNAEVATAVLEQCAAHTGTTLPDKITVKVLLDLIRIEAGESLPSEFTDGMPDPKATDTAPATT